MKGQSFNAKSTSTSTTTQSFSYYFEMIIPYIIKNSCNFATNKNLA